MPVYSHSKFATYETCPQKYKLRYLHRIRPSDETEGIGIESFLGDLVHATLKKLNSLEELPSFYNEQWHRNQKKNILIAKRIS